MFSFVFTAYQLGELGIINNLIVINNIIQSHTLITKLYLLAKLYICPLNSLPLSFWVFLTRKEVTKRTCHSSLSIQVQHLFLIFSDDLQQCLEVASDQRRVNLLGWRLFYCILVDVPFIGRLTFWNSLCLWYGWILTKLPSSCICGASFTATYTLLSLRCRRFQAIWHSRLRNTILTEICGYIIVDSRLTTTITTTTTTTRLVCRISDTQSVNCPDQAQSSISVKGISKPSLIIYVSLILFFNPTTSIFYHLVIHKTKTWVLLLMF